MVTSMANEVELTAAVEQQLRDAKMPFQKGVVVGDASPDFVVTTPEGEHVVLEVKAWEPNTANTARALHQVERSRSCRRPLLPSS